MRWFAAEERVARDYSFAPLPVPALMQQQLAAAFARRIAPGSGIGSRASVRHLYTSVQQFCAFVAGLADPPKDCLALAPSHIDEFLVFCRGENGVVREWFRSIKSVLRVCDSLAPDVSVKVREPNPRSVSLSTKASYSRAEFTRIAQAARSDLRNAATRIRANRVLLARYRAGTVTDTDRRCELLEFVDTHGDVPRYEGATKWGQVVAKGWVTQGGFGSVYDIMSWLHLNVVELAAAAMLLAVMTGQNPSVIKGTPARHHRTDGHIDDTLPTAIIDVHKPRRGRRAYMNAVLTDVPDWISVPANPERLTSRDQLHTPFGVYALLYELTMSARERCGSDRLLVGYHGGGGAGRGFRALGSREPLEKWSTSRRVPSDAGDAPLRVTLDRLRLTYVELHQKPVAHTEETLVNEYLGRNKGNLSAYREVVEAALQEEVAKARSRAVIDLLTKEELAQADPEQLAADHGLKADVLTRMLARELDTVMVACTDNANGPFTGPDQPCRASFMMCLGCPCARALPHHLPVQVLVRDHLQARKSHMTPMVWVQRFGLPHAQLTDLLNRHDPLDISDARAGATPEQIRLVERFVNRELDIR